MRILFLITYYVLFAAKSFAQNYDIKIDLNEFKKVEHGYLEACEYIKEADKLYKKKSKGYYIEAKDLYLKAYAYNNLNAELNYKIGICFLESINKNKAVKYLEESYKIKANMTPFINWHLGRAYHHNLEFEKAIKHYKKFRMYITKSGGSPQKIDFRIKQCKNGIELVKNSVNVEISKAENINSKYDDYSPLITADESKLIFTSRREGSTGNKKSKDGMYYEDIYFSTEINGTWSKPENIGKPLNTEFHEATVGLSPDGQELFLYHHGDIFHSVLNGEEWSVPQPVSEVINSEEVENSACFSYDGKEIFFIRGKKNDDEKSNSDIWLSKMKNGVWTTPKKLPRIINSEFDEDGVFMHPDGKTLYFSSKGHNSMGGFDVFKAIRNPNGSWQRPINLGYPINTPDDDLFFVLSANGKHAYYSSIRNNSEGLMDIYKIDFNPKKDTIPDTTEFKIYLTIVKGTVKDGKTGEFLEAEIEIFDNEKSEVVLNKKSNSADGKYLISLPSGKNYGMEVRKKAYLFHSENFNVPEVSGFQEIIKDIKLFPIEKDVKVILRNIFYDFNKSTLRSESFTELNKLKKLLDENPKMQIEISGHTDNTGTHEYNRMLSEARAESVVKYLIEQGVSKERLKFRGASWDEPRADNKTKEGRQKNRRVEFKILN